MFNFAADQLFVVQPRNTGGGILSLLLSFDTLCAGINFQNISTQQKLLQWKQHLNNTVANAHMHGHINFCSPAHNELIHSADSSDRYVHKLHFHEHWFAKQIMALVFLQYLILCVDQWYKNEHRYDPQRLFHLTVQTIFYATDSR